MITKDNVKERQPFKRTISEETVKEILRLRKRYGMTYVEIGEEVGVSKDSVKRYIDKYRSPKEPYTVRSRTRNLKPKDLYRTNREYNFLQYIRPVFKWAVSNTGLPRPRVEMLLYLYSKGTFTKTEFYNYHKIVGIHQLKTFDEFINNGYMTVWRDKKKGRSALYSLTNKAKIMCAKMHKMLVGDMDIPSIKNNDPSKPEARINGYYMDVIKKINKERKKSM